MAFRKHRLLRGPGTGKPLRTGARTGSCTSAEGVEREPTICQLALYQEGFFQVQGSDTQWFVLLSCMYVGSGSQEPKGPGRHTGRSQTSGWEPDLGLGMEPLRPAGIFVYS